MRPMRRVEREVTEETHIREILEGCETLRLGLWDGEEVYVVPVSYGYLYEEGRCTLSGNNVDGFLLTEWGADHA